MLSQQKTSGQCSDYCTIGVEKKAETYHALSDSYTYIRKKYKTADLERKCIVSPVIFFVKQMSFHIYIFAARHCFNIARMYEIEKVIQLSTCLLQLTAILKPIPVRIEDFQIPIYVANWQPDLCHRLVVVLDLTKISDNISLN